VIGFGFASGADGCGSGAGKFAVAIRVVPGKVTVAEPDIAEAVGAVEIGSVVCKFCGAAGAGGCEFSVPEAEGADGRRLDIGV
jgi:hypothetical protein